MRPVLGSAIRTVAAYVAGIAVLGMLAVHAVHSVASALARQSLEVASSRQPAAKVAASSLEVSHRVLQEDWFRSFSTSRNSRPSVTPPPGRVDRSQRSNLKGPSDPPPFTLFGTWDDFGRRDWVEPLPQPRQQYRTYRTVCVRLCDGFYFPISFGTTQDRFARDEAQCISSCGSEAKLYVYRNPGEEPDQMVDLRGQPYAKLKTAFLYRTSYNESCKCRPHAWEQVSLDRHRLYALEAKRNKGDRSVQAEIDQIRERQRLTVQEQRAIRKQSKTEQTRNGRRVTSATAQGGPTASDVSATLAAGAAPSPEPAPAPLPRGGELRTDATTASDATPPMPGDVTDSSTQQRKAKKAQRPRTAAKVSTPVRAPSSGGDFAWRHVFER